MGWLGGTLPRFVSLIDLIFSFLALHSCESAPWGSPQFLHLMCMHWNSGLEVASTP